MTSTLSAQRKLDKDEGAHMRQDFHISLLYFIIVTAPVPSYMCLFVLVQFALNMNQMAQPKVVLL